MPKIVAGYCRVSTAEQAEHGYSIDEQVARIRSYCDALGWTLFKVYTDAGISGTTIDRPALQEMLQDIKEKKVNTVLVYKLDRLSRSQKDALFLIEDEFIGNGIDFVSMSENFDTSSPFGRAMIGILAVFAQLEREQIKERMSLGKGARAKNGLWHGGNPPIGYDYNPDSGNLEINEFEAEIVRRIFDMYLSGIPVAKIEETLINEGVQSHYGYIYRDQIRAMLQKPIYAGIIVDKGKEYPGTHEAIIDKETYNKAQKMVSAGKDAWNNSVRSGKNVSLLTGLLFCEQCGGRYHAVKRLSGNFKYECYSRDKTVKKMVVDPSCKNKIWKKEELDDLILSQIKSLSIDESAITPKTQKPSLKVYQDRLKKLRKQRSKLMDLYSIGNMDIHSITEKIDPLNQQISALESQIASAEKSSDASKKISAEVIHAAELIDMGTLQQKRALVLSIIDHIGLDGDTVNIYWKL